MKSFFIMIKYFFCRSREMHFFRTSIIRYVSFLVGNCWSYICIYVYILICIFICILKSFLQSWCFVHTWKHPTWIWNFPLMVRRDLPCQPWQTVLLALRPCVPFESSRLWTCGSEWDLYGLCLSFSTAVLSIMTKSKLGRKGLRGWHFHVTVHH